MKKLGSCGESNEHTAAGFHAVVGVLYTVMLLLEGTMIAWHFLSVKKHLERAKDG